MIEEVRWEHYRTCSRVSGGICQQCLKECYFGSWILRSPDRRQVLCETCYQKIHQPEAYAAKLLAQAEAEKRRLQDAASPPPGSITTPNGGLFGPKQTINVGGLKLGEYRQVLQEPSFDTIPINSAYSSKINFFQTPQKEKT